MIKPLNSFSNTSFTGNNMDDYLKQTREGVNPTYRAYAATDSQPRKTIKENFADIAKGYNKTKGYIAGTAKGIASGVLFGGITGIAAKNIKQDANIFKAFKGTMRDIGKCVIKTVKFAPSIITKSPLENVKTIFKRAPKKYFGEYLTKSNKAAAVISIGVGMTVLAVNIIKAKIRANRQNADVDHSLNIKH